MSTKGTIPCRERLHRLGILENDGRGLTTTEQTRDFGGRVANSRKNRVNCKPSDSLRDREKYHWRPIRASQMRFGGNLFILQNSIQAANTDKDIWCRRGSPRLLGLKNHFYRRLNSWRCLAREDKA